MCRKNLPLSEGETLNYPLAHILAISSTLSSQEVRGTRTHVRRSRRLYTGW